jgi:uncharacterized protein
MIIFIFIFRIAEFLTDYLWFDSLGFKSIFMVSIEAAVLLFFVSSLVFFVFLMLNLWIASKCRENLKNLIKFKTKFWISILLSFFIGTASASQWMTVLQYFRQISFGLADPILNKDVSFYIFTLPFFQAVLGFAFICVIFTVIFVIIDYFQSIIISFFKQPQVKNANGIPQYSINLKQELGKLKRKAIVHLSLLFSLFFLLLAIKHYLTRFSIMYSEKGIVVGAGYTDVAVFLPIINILIVFAVLIAVFIFFWMIFSKKTFKTRSFLMYTIIAYFIIAFVGQSFIPGVVQSLKVSPNEINLERPYIENNIEFTKIAYGLSDVVEKDFSVSDKFDKSIISNSPKTIENIRILDWRPLTTTYKQTQEIRLYYDLSGIDIDRYNIEGKDTQVMLAPRELEQSQIIENAKTWVNLHMVYTHGYGVVMSPVNSVTKEGLPNYLIKDIPPVNTVTEENLVIERPEIYYGEKDNSFVLVNTQTDEFNYPKGNSNEYNNYDGKGGIVLDSFAKKLLMALRFRDIKILLTSEITPESKIMFTRNIQDRIRKITPFLALDEDPYLVIDDGKLFWIQDAYTISGNFPYSAKVGNINYMRNSVKIVVDAFNGDVSYYIIDENDPIIQTYSNIFYGEFKSFDEMPTGLKDHIRYPEDLFKIQSQIYSTYHMEDSTVFYNKEDAWQLPKEIYGTGQQIQVEPYYNIIKLPDEAEEEFVLMISFTPIKKDNMVAWLAARSDDENYGKLLLYKFPKDKLVYGPSQIEAKIDQDSEISQQLTLWGQQGSRVTRGNLLVIPIENSILYVEPLYIQSEQGQLPELKRVLVSDGERVAMEETLSEALIALFGETRSISDGTNSTIKSTDIELLVFANEYYENVEKAMKEGDWSSIGDNLEKLGQALKALTEE